ncbi:MAG TPA: SUMF1/EgtB/PvdO family nonheme iron enzyme [Polyangiaceae bacterium]|nr:SUMF1/EgtB/PvdO family nonheme iron enzyme [Polyangiaceae bacterium]
MPCLASSPRPVWLPFAALFVASGGLLAFGGAPQRSNLADAPTTTPELAATDAEPPLADPAPPAAGDEAPDDDGDDASGEDGDGEDDALADLPDAGKKKPHGGCPSNMVRAGNNYCIDRYEAPNRRGAHPFVMQSAIDANVWCTDHHKRLCTEDEWIAACQGDDHRTYPYGNEHIDGQCNDDRAWQKVDEALLAKWPSAEAKQHAKDLYQGTPSGSKRKCRSEAGARDLTGNVEEWVVRTREHANAYPYILIGCYWAGCYGGNKPTCHSTNNAHGPEFRFYETGFRCCRDAAGAKK